ncbi:hypothetical protein [Microlunatus flavus]|uniref:hypothetical protein n=1 Tax=Microlunatus flavus TaxID=1036181 RepID=UPI00147E768F|nr:hypothetical protein [Microlunatus flavus]
MSSGQPTGTAQVSFPIDDDLVAEGLVPVVVWSDGNGGWRWLPTSWKPGDRDVLAQTEHFSRGFLAGIDAKAMAAKAKDKLEALVTGRAGVKQPSCKKSDDGSIDVSSSSGDKIKWCVEKADDGGHLVKVSNNLRAFVEITYPTSWKVQGDTRFPSFTPDGLKRLLGTAVVGRDKPKGYSVRIVDSADTLTLRVPKSQGGKLRAAFSIESWALSGIDFGWQVYSGVAQAAKSKVVADEDKTARLRYSLFAGLDDQKGALADAVKACSEAAQDLANVDPDDKTIGLQTFKFAVKCVPHLVEALAKTETGWVVGAVLVIITTTYDFITTSLNLLSSGIRDLFDEVSNFTVRGGENYYLSLAPRTEPIYNTPANPMGWTLTTDGLGPMLIGLSGKQGEALGVATTSPATGCPDATLPYRDSGRLYDLSHHHGAFGVWGRDGRLEVVRVDSSSFGTRKGVHVGDTKEKLRQTYGDALEPGPEVSADGPLLMLTSGGNYLEFFIDHGKVASIFAGSGTPMNMGYGDC